MLGEAWNCLRQRCQQEYQVYKEPVLSRVPWIHRQILRGVKSTVLLGVLVWLAELGSNREQLTFSLL